MFVLTVDQRGSRGTPDAVPGVLASLNDTYAADLELPFERTAGDEVQAMTADATTAVSIVVALVRRRGWSIGLGAGEVETPLPDSVRAGRGPAFIEARSAVDRAKHRPSGVAVAGPEPESAERAETGLWLLCGLIGRRSDAGWEAIDAMAGTARQAEAASRLGISAQAMSRRLRVAGWAEERRGRMLAAWLLEGMT